MEKNAGSFLIIQLLPVVYRNIIEGHGNYVDEIFLLGNIFLHDL